MDRIQYNVLRTKQHLSKEQQSARRKISTNNSEGRSRKRKWLGFSALRPLLSAVVNGAIIMT